MSQVNGHLLEFARHGATHIFLCEVSVEHRPNVVAPSSDWTKVSNGEYVTFSRWRIDEHKLVKIAPETKTPNQEWRVYQQACVRVGWG